ncbi:fibronectin type III domain-containing protein [Halocola ammonii]
MNLYYKRSQLLRGFLASCILLSAFLLQGQTYNQVEFTSGLTADVIANGVGAPSSSTNNDIDGGDYVYISEDYQLDAGDAPLGFGLPSDGIIVSPTEDGMDFQMSPFATPYTGNNSMRLEASGSTGTLEFADLNPAVSVHFLVMSGGGPGSITGTIHFLDGSTQSIALTNVPDWYNGTSLPTAIGGIGRVNLASEDVDNPAGNPRVYELTVDINEENYDKTITSVDFVKGAAGGGVVNVFAMSYKETPSCFPPSDLTVDNITTSSVDLSWTPDGAHVSWEYMVQPAGNGVPTMPGNGTADNPVEVGGLSPDTNYEVYIRGNCNTDGYSQWIGPVNFTTPVEIECDQGEYDFNYCYGNNENVSFSYMSENSAPLTVEFNSGSFQNNFFGGGTADDFIIYDGIDESGMVLFNSDNNGNNVEGLEFELTSGSLYMTITSNGFTSCSSGAQNALEYTVYCSESTAACVRVDDVIVSDVAALSAQIGWTAVEGQTDWEVAVQPAGTGEPTEAGTPTMNNPFTPSDLDPETEYEVYVRANCGADGTSIWEGPVEFTTTIACPAPTNLSVSDVTPTSAQLHWEGTPDQTEWEVAVQTQGSGVPTEADVTLPAESFVTGIDPGVTYEFYVRGNCGVDLGMSDWAGPFVFGGYAAMEITAGLSDDVIANGVGDPNTTTTNDLDGVNYVYMSEDYQEQAGDPLQGFGLPANGVLNSPNTPGLIFHMSPEATPYEGNNSLRIETTGNSGLLEFNNNQPAQAVFLAGVSGSGSANLNGTINFADGSSQPIPSTLVPDWYFQNSQPIIIQGMGRVNLNNNNVESDPNNPRVYQLEIPINPENQTKIIESMEIVKESGSGVMNIFAASLCFTPTCIIPGEPVVSDVAPFSATIDWTAPEGQDAWEIAIVESGAEIPASGTAVTETTYPAADLMDNTTYDVYIRTSCGAVFSDWVGPVEFTTPVACELPTGLSATNIQSTSADLSWTGAEGQTEWEVVVQLEGTGEPTEAGEPAATESFDADGLSSGSIYEFYVRGYCGEVFGWSDWAGPYTFGGYTTLEVTSGFSADVIANGVGTPDMTTTNDLDGASYAYLSEDYQEEEGDALLGFGLPVSGVLTSPNVPGLTYQMSPFADPYEGDNSLRIDTIGNGGTLEIADATPAQTIYLAAVSGSGESFITGSINFDDGTSQAIASSLIPDWYGSNALPVIISEIGRISLADYGTQDPFNNPRIYQLTIDLDPENQAKIIESIDITKDSGSGVANIFAVSMRFAPTCIAPADLAVTDIDPTSANVSWSALDGQTDWEVAIVPSGDEIPENGTAVSETQYEAMDLDPGTDYDVYVRSDCGDEYSEWVGPVSFSTPIGIDCNSGMNNFTFCYENNQFTSFLYSSLDGSSLAIMFNAGTLEDSFNGTYDDLIIYDGMDDSGEVLFNSDEDGFEMAGLLFVAESGSIYMTVQGDVSNSCGSGSEEALDYDVFCTSADVCIAPSDLQLVSLSATTAEIAWTSFGGSTDWEIVVQPAGTGEPTEAGTATMDNPYTATDLDPDTDYEVYVRMDCGEGELTSWSGPLNFTTPIEIVCADGVQNFTHCYENNETSSFSYSSSTGESLTISFNAGTMEFNDFAGNTYDDLIIYDGVDESGAVLFNSDVDGGELSGLTFEATSGNIYMTINSDGSFSCGSGNEESLDYDIYCSSYVSCEAPIELMVAEITETSAELSWTAGIGQTDWEIVVQAAGTGVPTGAGTATTDNPYTVMDLDPSTDYEFYVRVNCGEETFSEWSEPQTFSTLTPPCEDPTELTVSDINPTSAQLSWTAADGQTDWEIVVQPSGSGEPTGAGIATQDNPYTVMDLDPETEYEFYVRADCGDDNFSDWSGPELFITGVLICEDPTDLSATDITATSAVLSWTAGEGQTDWEVVVQPAGSGEPTGAGTATQDNPYTAMDLDAETDYEFYVRADCGDGNYSEWVGPQTFMTLVGVGEYELSGVSVFPNPFSNSITIDSEQKLDNIRVMNVAGQVVYETAGDSRVIDLSKLESGVYFLEVKADSMINRMRIVKD